MGAEQRKGAGLFSVSYELGIDSSVFSAIPRAHSALCQMPWIQETPGRGSLEPSPTGSKEEKVLGSRCSLRRFVFYQPVYLFVLSLPSEIPWPSHPWNFWLWVWIIRSSWASPLHVFQLSPPPTPHFSKSVHLSYPLCSCSLCLGIFIQFLFPPPLLFFFFWYLLVSQEGVGINACLQMIQFNSKYLLLFLLFKTCNFMLFHTKQSCDLCFTI